MTFTKHKYRDVDYQYREWKTWNNKDASGFTCNCEDLLTHVNVVSFSTQSEVEMKERIDDYLDNVEEQLIMKSIRDRACAEYYSNSYPGRYTGD